MTSIPSASFSSSGTHPKLCAATCLAHGNVGRTTRIAILNNRAAGAIVWLARAVGEFRSLSAGCRRDTFWITVYSYRHAGSPKQYNPTGVGEFGTRAHSALKQPA